MAKEASLLGTILFGVVLLSVGLEAGIFTTIGGAFALGGLTALIGSVANLFQ